MMIGIIPKILQSKEKLPIQYDRSEVNKTDRNGTLNEGTNFLN